MMMPKNILYFVLGIGVGAFPVAIAWRMQILTMDVFDAEFEITPESSYLSNDFGSETKVEFKSYIIKDGNRILHGPSLLWYPYARDAEIKIYVNGSLCSVRSRSINN